MSFPREEKRLHELSNFNPPPGYYEYAQGSMNNKKIASFGKGERFVDRMENPSPGPGTYSSQTNTQKRVSDNNKREIEDSTGQANIKISSIPSIPNKSATRVYEQLAPGILILHEEQYEDTNVGPGSYNINEKLVHKKTVAHRIPPPRAEKPIAEEEEPPVLHSIVEQIRNQKRLMNKQSVVKSSTVNKSQISPSDLCLEVIILREKLLRGDDNPPPGHYYNQDIHTSFKKTDPDKPSEFQCLQGKEERFKSGKEKYRSVGPGSYLQKEDSIPKGGYIPRSTRLSPNTTGQLPGPGSYALTHVNEAKGAPKGDYPPIFGSGSMRFAAATSTAPQPGPGSYQLAQKRNKKQKYIKIRKELLDANFTSNHTKNEQIYDIQATFNEPTQKKGEQRHLSQKNNHYFASKVSRFNHSLAADESMGPGNYECQNNLMGVSSFNRGNRGYLGPKVTRFLDYEVRPQVGPGTYNASVDPVKERKIMNIIL